jgi:hypothetical protein
MGDSRLTALTLLIEFLFYKRDFSYDQYINLKPSPCFSKTAYGDSVLLALLDLSLLEPSTVILDDWMLTQWASLTNLKCIT